MDIYFEDSAFSFLKPIMPKATWDGEYDAKLEEVDILVRYTDPWTNNIATMTNIKELEAFNQWYQTCKKQ